MNAHQRRIDRRSRSCVIFDLEAIPTQWGDITKVAIMGNFFDGGNFRPLVGDFFDFIPAVDKDAMSSLVEPLSTTLRILKGREPQLDGLCLSMDFSRIEERIAALNPDFIFGYGDAR